MNVLKSNIMGVSVQYMYSVLVFLISSEKNFHGLSSIGSIKVSLEVTIEFPVRCLLY